MQHIYAFKQSKQSDYHVAVDVIKQTFAPDLNSMEFQDKEVLDKRKSQAIELFESHYQADQIKISNDTSEEVYNAAADALEFYKKQVKNDLEFYKKQMLTETEKNL